LAKIATGLRNALGLRAASGAATGLSVRILAEGRGWSVSDVICDAGPADRPFEEQHSEIRVALIGAGTFQYHTSAGRALMSPGSLMLGSAGQFFECAHDHGTGDRCLAFGYSPEYFEGIASDAGLRFPKAAFQVPSLPPLRKLSPILARACAALLSQSVAGSTRWEELSLELAVRTLELVSGRPPSPKEPSSTDMARITMAIKAVERDLSGLSVGSLAANVGLSPYHFLRTFERLTGVTPHQYILRTRLTEAAVRLSIERGKVIDILLDCGFADVSNFNRMFRSEFGVSPRAYRAERACRT